MLRSDPIAIDTPSDTPSNFWEGYTRETTPSTARHRTLTVEEYEVHRERDPKSVANLPPSSYLSVFFSAVEQNRLDLAESVVVDILDRYEGQNSSRCKMLEQILAKEVWPLERGTILRVLQHLNDSSRPNLESLLTHHDGNIARKMLHHAEIFDTDRPFLRLFYPPLLKRLGTIQSPKKFKIATFQPPHLIYVSFSAIHKLISMSFNEHALNIFQILVDTGYVSLEALHNVDNSSGNASLIISMVVIRSCLHWNYRALAASLITELITANPTDKAIIGLNIDIIHSLLISHPTTRDVATSGHLIRRIHPHSPVPDSIIRLFYNSAVAAGAKEEAEDLYSFTREDKVRDTHRYPPPPDVALPWLMKHFATASSHTHLSRTLATEAVDDNLWIPTPFRAQFIANTAALGYATHARALWERHVMGRDGAVVAGNSALMIRMVSLFWNMHRTNFEKASALEAEEEQRPEVQKKITKYRKASEDAAALAERVRHAFVFHHAPLENAQHWDLTSLARACFIVGKLSEGYEALRYLFKRKESPDLYDCNVALSAVSQLNPRLAAKMIEKMTTIGLQPDSVSFGTVLHYAVMQGEREVVDIMIERIRELGNKDVSTKTLANLIRSSLTLGEENGSLETLQHTLANIMHLIKSFPELNLSPQPYIGKALVYAAIRTRDGAMAYNFWKLLLKKAAQWGDKEQVDLRHGIARLIQQPSFPLREHRKAMLVQLGLWKSMRRERNAPTT
ncbi:hypothetical protein C0995_004693 [Termitomyces sp. Mi166|nr:hypothetical protein C0995_004693 [Termitomyces sp. Mi166\